MRFYTNWSRAQRCAEAPILRQYWSCNEGLDVALSRGGTLVDRAKNLLMFGAEPCMCGHVQDTFIFRVEGTGVLKVEQVVVTALGNLITKLRNLQEALPPDPSDM